MRVKTALIMVTDIENIEDAKESIEEQVDQILQGWTEEGWKGHPDIRPATRSELEELAAAGALLPNPGFIEVKKPKAVRVKPGMKFDNGSTIKVVHTEVDPIRGDKIRPSDLIVIMELARMGLNDHTMRHDMLDRLDLHDSEFVRINEVIVNYLDPPKEMNKP